MVGLIPVPPAVLLRGLIIHSVYTRASKTLRGFWGASSRYNAFEIAKVGTLGISPSRGMLG